MKVLGLALYGPLAASHRYRLGQYVPGLARLGIDLEVKGLLDDDYLRRRFRGERVPPAVMLRAGIRRLAHLLRRAEYDLAILYGELFPLMPAGLEKALLGLPYVYDFDDAFYLKYRSGRLGRLSPWLGDKFDRLIRDARAVAAGNRTLAEYAGRYNPNVRLLPTVVDTERYRPRRRVAAAGAPLTVGWIGSPSTAAYLQELAEPLSVLGREGAVRWLVIGGRAPRVDGVEVVELDWSEAGEVEAINGFDIGVMPLPDDPWARGKCAFKLIQYMACGVPVIASPVGANVDVVGGDRGLVASTPQQWLEALRQLRDRPERRRTLGAAGRERVVEHYSLARNLPELAALISEAAEGHCPCAD